MSIDRPPFRIERKDGHSAIRIMLTEPLYKYYGVISNSTKIAGAPEAIIEIREYVNALIGELHVAGWTITFCIAGLLTYLVERAVSIDGFDRDYCGCFRQSHRMMDALWSHTAGRFRHGGKELQQPL
jgi:hypothetical protein